MNEHPGLNVLHFLLDSFERRRDPAARAISVSIRCVQGYADQVDASVRLATNQRLREWEERGWVDLRWEPGEHGNILRQIALHVEAVPAIYQFLERTPHRDRKRDMESLLQRYQSQVGPVFGPVIDELLVQLHAGRSIKPLTFDDLQRAEDLLRVMVGLHTLDGELPERNFSARVLGNSKRLAMLSSAVTSLLELAYPNLVGLPRAELWQAAGLLANPGHVYMHGPMVFVLNGKEIDVNVFSPDVGIPVHTIPQIQIKSITAQYLLTIENRTTFYDYLAGSPANGLVLYIGGFPNQARRHVLSQIKVFAPTLPFYHWGDIDYGGFAILAHLRHSLPGGVLPYRMDVATLAAHSNSWLPLSQNDRRNLKRLLLDPNLWDLTETIEFMLANSAKLEQEAELMTLGALEDKHA